MRVALALGAVISAAACTSAMAQSAAAPQITGKRVTNVDFSIDEIYDSNVAHQSATLSAARGLHAEDETTRPHLGVDLVQPIGREAIFLNGFAGYDFHRINKQLDRVNVGLTGGGVVSAGRCRPTLYGSYFAGQSDPEEVPGPTVKNLLTTAAGAFSVSCGLPTGIQGQFQYRHETADNSNAQREIANHRSDSFSGGAGYGNPSLGTLMLNGSYSRQEFPNRLTAAGTTGDHYESESYGLSYSRELSSRLKGSVALNESILKRSSAPAGIAPRTSGLNYNADLTYAANAKLELSLAASRAYQPSNRPGKLYDLVTSTQLNGRYALGQRIFLTLGAEFVDLKSNIDSSIPFPLPTRYQQRAGFGSISYKQSRRISVTAELRQEERTTDIPNFNYSDTRATLSLDVAL